MTGTVQSVEGGKSRSGNTLLLGNAMKMPSGTRVAIHWHLGNLDLLVLFCNIQIASLKCRRDGSVGKEIFHQV